MSLDDLYQELILEHARYPHHRGTLADPTVTLDAQNPTCGDEIHLQLKLSGDERKIEDIAFSGHGCSISQASASMMTDLVLGLSVKEALEKVQAFQDMMRTGEPREGLGDAVALAGVSRFPVRIKCALLAWMALKEALEETGAM
ncbi:MAG: SUF system NifU family Fe-S cluster assembly protein [Bacillota bacterium]|nr:SUF system NifU family Fe-S cluster assembly protein [Bacillota bacterium]